MSKKVIKLAKNLSLPLDFATERIAFLARTGAGKSGGMRVMFEQYVMAKLFSIFIDPKGYSSTASTIHVALTKLRKFEAVEGGGSSGVKAADVFFE